MCSYMIKIQINGVIKVLNKRKCSILILLVICMFILAGCGNYNGSNSSSSNNIESSSNETADQSTNQESEVSATKPTLSKDITDFSFIDTTDLLSKNDVLVPDGLADGHFQFTLVTDEEIRPTFLLIEGNKPFGGAKQKWSWLNRAPEEDIKIIVDGQDWAPATKEECENINCQLKPGKHIIDVYLLSIDPWNFGDSCTGTYIVEINYDNKASDHLEINKSFTLD